MTPPPSMARNDSNDEPASRSGPAARYDRLAMLLHWLVAVAIAFQLGWGWYMQTLPKGVGTLRVDAFNLHKSIGFTVLLLMLVRLAWRVAHRPPPLLGLPEWEQRAAHANHALLYVLAILQPLTGLLGSAVSGYPIRLWGLRLPALLPASETLKELLSGVHLALSWLLLAAILLHVAAALKHALVDRDRVLARMLPGRRTRHPPPENSWPAGRRG